MDKEEVILEIKKLGKMLDDNEITLQKFNDKISFLIRYKSNKSYAKNSNYYN